MRLKLILKLTDLTSVKNIINYLNTLYSVNTVMVPVPDIDRGRWECRNIKAVVVDCQPNGLYRLGTKLRLLNQAYSRNQFTPVKQKFILISEVPKEKEISL